MTCMCMVHGPMYKLHCGPFMPLSLSFCVLCLHPVVVKYIRSLAI